MNIISSINETRTSEASKELRRYNVIQVRHRTYMSNDQPAFYSAYANVQTAVVRAELWMYTMVRFT
jgi:hypothetical protein